MKKRGYALLTAFVFSILMVNAQFAGEYVPNEIMVMLKPGNNIDDLIIDLNNDGYAGQFRMKQVLSNRYKIYLLEHDAILGNSQALIYDVKKMDQIAVVQLNHYIEDRATPDDASYVSQQWNMNNTAQTGGTVDADIDAPEAWDITTGGVTAEDDTIVVAVVDGGIQANHPDLQDNIWKNYIELAGVAGVDDDGNGYIDDFGGWDASGNDNTLPTSAHATHCAGIVGARGNNSIGVTGVNWNVKILNVRGSSGTESVVVLAYDYISSLRELYNNTNGAAGAFVVATSNSFGVNNGVPASYPIWCAMYDTMGVLGILSAGAGPNQNWDIDVQGDIPTTCPSNYMIAVTNTTNTDARYGSAPYGPIHMDIGAPGTAIYSTYTTSTYQFSTGTSMATPHVAGAIGLYYAGACNQFIIDYKADPGLLAQQMRTYLLTGVDSIAALSGIISSEGRLNIHKGLLKVETYNCLSLPPVANFGADDQSVCLGATVNYADSSTNGPTSWNWSFPGGSPSSSSLQNPTIAYNTLGSYNAQLIVTNSDGVDTILFTNYITVNSAPAAPIITENAGVLESSQLGAGNQWYYVGGLPIIGATNDTYAPSTSGNYYVVYTDINGCTAASSMFSFIIGIDDEPAISFAIYPNPASEKILIDAGTIVKANIKIMDLSGRTVISTKMNQALLQIDLSTLASGVYMIKVEYGNKSITKKIIKR